jgi:cytochrome oxidase Cu insertion factor (SCO1/SenC/PrrC family)
MMAHSPKVFLVDPEGQWRAVYDPPLAPGLLASDLQKIVAEQKSLKLSASEI